jgi:flotillin
MNFLTTFFSSNYMFLGFFGVFLVGIGAIVLALRRVVPTNEVHIVQYSNKTVSYGKDTHNGNTYYEWPSWVPFLGLSKSVLPTSVFDLDLKNYEAYDRGRLPFLVDVKAFFCISDSNVAAQRVASFEELHNQLSAIVQGAVRTILASNEIEQIMQGRSKFGEEFTKEVTEQLSNWGVSTVKNIELMDIRDSQGSKVIHNIMEKKKSLIEMQSRTEVANNNQAATIAEIEAKRQISLSEQEAKQFVGLRQVQTEKEVGIAQQESYQLVKEQEKISRERQMDVERVQQLRQAEITKDVTLVQAEQNRLTQITLAKGNLEARKLDAEAALELKKREADGILAEGNARAESEKAMLLAPVQAQVSLAKEIGSNENYQKYLVTIRQVEANQAVGIEQAKALTHADVKVICNTGEPTTGLKNVMEIFSSKGGTEVGAALEGLANTDMGAKVLTALGVSPSTSSSKLSTNGKVTNGVHH